MNGTVSDKLCACSGTTERQIKKMLDKGIDDLEGISRATGACSGCGACDTDILAFIAACKAEAARENAAATAAASANGD